MDYSDFILARLKTLKWHKMTKHYDQHLIMSRDTRWGQLANTGSGQWFLVKDNEVARLPYWLFLFICGKHIATHHFGPYVFYNNFELTAEARYLKEMFKYPQLTPTAAKKVQTILDTYGPCISINEEFVKALQEREANL